MILSFFFFNDTATTEIYTLSLHDALPISNAGCAFYQRNPFFSRTSALRIAEIGDLSKVGRRSCHRSPWPRSEEHTSELQSQSNLVCRLLLEKKKTLPDTIYVTSQDVRYAN